MRALYYPHSLNHENVLVGGDEAHHFIKVLRLEKGEKVLLLNGEGQTADSEVEAITKKEVVLKINSRLSHKPKLELDLAVGVVKKEALEEILKASVEMGIRNLYLIRTQYSQILPEWSDRFQKLLVSALEQSNNPFLTKIIMLEDLKKIPWENYEQVVTFSTNQNGKLESELNLEKTLMLIGPEGGFSEAEESFLKEQKSLFMQLPLPILRAKTAAILATGFLLGKSAK